MGLFIVNIHGDIEGDYEIIKQIPSAESCREADDYENEIADLHNRLDIAEYDKERYKEEITILEAENKGEWIPVSERLPEHYQNILFSTKTDRVFEGRYFKDETEHQWYSFRDECFAWNNVVTAWMPLPEPYKADREGNE